MLKGIHYPKVKSISTIALFTMLLISTMTMSAKSSPGIWLEYDRNDPDVGHSGTDPLAVRFTPPRIWLGLGYICTLFEVTAIRLYVASDSWIWNAGFDVYVADENHQTLKSFLNQHPTDNGWFNLDLTGWTDDTRYVETHFFVEFAAHAPADQESWAILLFDEAVVDEGEASYQRSFRYTYGPDNPNAPAWLPIELTYPYGPGDLLIRVELEPETPVSILPTLRDQILEADNTFFDGFENKLAPKMKRVLIKKVNEAMFMFEMGNYQDGLDKLVHDIGPKLADPRPTPATSWLHIYPEGSANQKLVTSFAVVCQSIVQMAQKSASPPGVHERCDFNGDTYDDLAIGVPYENLEGKSNAGAVNVLYGSPDGITEEQDQYWRQGINGVKGGTETGDHFGEALAIGNFNGDNYDDLAIGVPYEDLVTMEQAVIPDVGAVNILYGSPSGLTEEGDQAWWQNLIAYSPDMSEAGDNFGATLAAGDFNGDGYDDLAIGVPNEHIGDVEDAGEVDIMYGSSAGLTTSGNQVWSQGPLEGVAQYHDRFGEALTVGDFDGDGFEDLAIGTPNEDVGDIQYAGAVNVIYGSSTGLTVAGNQIWHQNSPSIVGMCENLDYFGGSMTAGDFNGDGYDDLAVGVPRESIWLDTEEIAGAGAVNILAGSSIGLSAAANQIVYQSLWDEECEQEDNFGASLAAGDFDHDGYEDLAVGAPREDYTSEQITLEDDGVISVIYGCSLGLAESTRCDNWFEQDLWPALEYLPTYDSNNFGKTLTTGDFNGDGRCDLAIGVPRADIYLADQAGSVKIMYASTSGLSWEDSSAWWQDKEGVDGDSEDDDHFGSSLPGSHWYGI